MKNWKYIHVGNYDAQKELGIKPAPFNQNHLSSEDEKKVKDLFQKNGGDYEKTIKDIKLEYKSLPEEGIRRMLYNLVGVPQKSKNESIYKQEASMFGGLGKKAKEEIGNETYQHKLYPDKYVIIDGKNYKIITDGKVEKSGELTDAILYGINQTYKRVSSMNSKTANARLGKFLMEGGHTAELVEEGGKFVIKFDDGSTETFMTRKAADSYLKAHSELYIGNSKTVNQSAQDKFLDDINGIKAKYKQEGKELNLARLMYELKRIGWAESDFTKLKWPTNIGNETKGERKFGKVMGEFEEGALKTPQGKTVTDPAQAKAIAYSEADKVDNLKRARNAMNKKVGNLDHVEEGDYVSVRYQGEIVDGVVRKIQGTQALVTIDGTDMWFPIRSLKEST